jgi:hypothetical protein
MKITRFLVLLLFIISACSKGESEAPVTPASPPSKAVLILPALNEACTSGTVISATQSMITLKWQASANTSSYIVTIKNLLTNISESLTSPDPQLNVTLLRNTPYSWYVTSKSSAIAETAQSDTWKFYNAGPGAVTYAPYPSEIIAPIMGQVLNNVASVKLEWKGSDVENDIIAYDIWFGSGNSTSLFKSNYTETSLMVNVPLNSSMTYNWKVITKDSKGNNSSSGVYQFTVN